MGSSQSLQSDQTAQTDEKRVFYSDSYNETDQQIIGDEQIRRQQERQKQQQRQIEQAQKALKERKERAVKTAALDKNLAQAVAVSLAEKRAEEDEKQALMAQAATAADLAVDARRQIALKRKAAKEQAVEDLYDDLFSSFGGGINKRTSKKKHIKNKNKYKKSSKRQRRRSGKIRKSKNT